MLMPFEALLPLLIISLFVPAAILGSVTAIHAQRRSRCSKRNLNVFASDSSGRVEAERTFDDAPFGLHLNRVDHGVRHAPSVPRPPWLGKQKTKCAGEVLGDA
jgi:hypothetical protein